jgi:hypothetical protein
MGTKPAASNKWYIDWSSFKCKQDCEVSSGGMCGGLAPETWRIKHESVDACCRAHVLMLLSNARHHNPMSGGAFV